MQRVRIYAGEGAAPRALAYALDGLRSELPAAVQVVEIGTEELLAGGWEASTGALRTLAPPLALSRAPLTAPPQRFSCFRAGATCRTARS
jgi:hypothetical protein